MKFSIFLTVKLEVEIDDDKEDWLESFVNELHYSFASNTEEVQICDTEITDWSSYFAGSLIEP